jgi:hypothetical protein
VFEGATIERKWYCLLVCLDSQRDDLTSLIHFRPLDLHSSWRFEAVKSRRNLMDCLLRDLLSLNAASAIDSEKNMATGGVQKGTDGLQPFA